MTPNDVGSPGRPGTTTPANTIPIETRHAAQFNGIAFLQAIQSERVVRAHGGAKIPEIVNLTADFEKQLFKFADTDRLVKLVQDVAARQKQPQGTVGFTTEEPKPK